MESGLICGTALVHSTTLSQPAIAPASTVASVTSPFTISSPAAPALRSAFAALRERTSPTGDIEASCCSCSKTSRPVRPPAPVTSTLRALAGRSASITNAGSSMGRADASTGRADAMGGMHSAKFGSGEAETGQIWIFPVIFWSHKQTGRGTTARYTSIIAQRRVVMRGPDYPPGFAWLAGTRVARACGPSSPGTRRRPHTWRTSLRRGPCPRRCLTPSRSSAPD